MTTYHSGTPPKGFKPGFESFLFNTKTHRLLQSKKGWEEFHLLDLKKKRILSSIYFHVSNGTAVSPLKAPFGSFEISNHISTKELYEFVFWIESELASKKINKIEIINPPESYTTNQMLITFVLVNHGYKIQAEPGCCIPVDENPLIGKMRPNKKNIFRQAQRAGLSYKKLPLSKLSEVYFFLESCRKEKNQSLSMSLTDLTKTIKALPESFYLVGTFLQTKLVAASIVIRVSSTIAYTFYSGHSKQYDQLSPLVFLISNLYDWCRQQGITLLDLGTSALDAKPNFNLLNFKIRVGGVLTPKYKFQKTLDS